MYSKQLVAFPVCFKKVDNGYVAWNDDIPVATQGKDLEEAIFMAKDAIELMAYDDFLRGGEIIQPKVLICENEDYDFVSHVICDLNKYLNLESEKKVKKNCTIPESLAKAAENKGVNFSKVLTNALEKELSLV